MKKMLAVVLTLLMLLPVLAMGVGAEETSSVDSVLVSRTVEQMDGYSVEISVWDTTGVQPLADIYTKSGSKDYVYRNSSGEILWTFTVNGTFSVETGTKATCIATSHSYNIVNSSWKLDTASTHPSSYQAVGDATFIKKVLFVTTDTKSCHLVLSCDAYGNLS